MGSVWSAIFWGAFSSASLYLGQLLAEPLRDRHRATGLIMGFGAGTLISAVAYELVPESSISDAADIGGGLAAGAIVYFVADAAIDRRGGGDRQQIDGGDGGSGLAMFLGALLDGVPEAFILGLSIALGGTISVAFLAAVFVSNIPQGVAGTISLETAGRTSRQVFRMWTGLTITCAAVAALGYVAGDSVPHHGVVVESFAAGALLMMMTDSMIPEAFANGGKLTGLMTTAGFAVATFLAAAQ